VKVAVYLASIFDGVEEGDEDKYVAWCASEATILASGPLGPILLSEVSIYLP